MKEDAAGDGLLQPVGERLGGVGAGPGEARHEVEIGGELGLRHKADVAFLEGEPPEEVEADAQLVVVVDEGEDVAEEGVGDRRLVGAGGEAGEAVHRLRRPSGCCGRW